MNSLCGLVTLANIDINLERFTTASIRTKYYDSHLVRKSMRSFFDLRKPTIRCYRISTSERSEWI